MAPPKVNGAAELTAAPKVGPAEHEGEGMTAGYEANVGRRPWFQLQAHQRDIDAFLRKPAKNCKRCETLRGAMR